MQAREDITDLLVAWGGGDEQALEQVMPILYKRLRGLAASFLRKERSDHTLQTLDLVHESFMRLVTQKREWQNRGQFFALSGQMMRRILIDHARRYQSEKWGAGAILSLDEGMDAPAEGKSFDLLALDDALKVLAEKSPDLVTLIELRYFLGFSREEAAEALGMSLATFGRRWQLARSWLYRYVVEGRRDEL